MRLPGIKYDRPVQSLGREDVNAPIRVARAQSAAAAYEGAGLRSLGETAVKLGGYLVDQQAKYSKHEAQMAVVSAASEMQDVVRTRREAGVIDRSSLPPGFNMASLPEEDDDIEPRPIKYHEHAVELFDADAKNIGKKYASRLKTPEAQQAFQLAWAKSTVRGRGTVINDAITLARDQTKAETFSAAMELADNGDADGATSLIRGHAPDIFSFSEAQQHIRSLQHNAAMAGPRQAMMSGDIMLMEQHVATLSDEEYEGALTKPQRLAMVQALETRIASTKAEFKAERSRETAGVAAALKIGVDNGSVNQSDLNEAFEKGIIPDRSTYISWSSQLAKNIAKNIQDTTRLTDIGNAIQGNVPYDDSDKKDKKAVNVFWEKAGGTYDAAYEMAAASNIIPSDATNMMLMDSHSNDPEKMAAAGQFYLSITEAGKHHLFKGVEGETGAMVRNIAENLDAGMPAGQAVEYAKQVVSIDPKTRSVLNQEYPALEAKNVDALEDFTDAADETDIKFFGEATPPLAMRGEFNRLTRNNYVLNGGDIDKARSASFRELTAKWGSTAVNPIGGQRLIKYPPERILALPSDDIEAHLLEEAAPLVKALGEDPNKIFIVHDDATVRNPFRNGWPIMYEDKYGGVWQVRNGKGTPVRYQPTIDQVKKSKAVAAAKRLEELRAGAPGLTNPLTGQPLNEPLDDLNEWRKEIARGN